MSKLGADWTNSVVSTTYASELKGQYVRSRIKMVVLGSVATLKDSAYHAAAGVATLGVSIIRGLGVFSFFSAGRFDRKVAPYTAAASGSHFFRSIGYALNLVSTLALGLLSPKTQRKLLSKTGLAQINDICIPLLLRHSVQDGLKKTPANAELAKKKAFDAQQAEKLKAFNLEQAKKKPAERSAMPKELEPVACNPASRPLPFRAVEITRDVEGKADGEKVKISSTVLNPGFAAELQSSADRYEKESTFGPSFTSADLSDLNSKVVYAKKAPNKWVDANPREKALPSVQAHQGVWVKQAAPVAPAAQKAESESKRGEENALQAKATLVRVASVYQNSSSAKAQREVDGKGVNTLEIARKTPKMTIHKIFENDQAVRQAEEDAEVIERHVEMEKLKGQTGSWAAVEARKLAEKEFKKGDSFEENEVEEALSKHQDALVEGIQKIQASIMTRQSKTKQEADSVAKKAAPHAYTLPKLTGKASTAVNLSEKLFPKGGFDDKRKVLLSDEQRAAILKDKKAKGTVAEGSVKLPYVDKRVASKPAAIDTAVAADKALAV